MLERWNDRCSPPWQSEDLEKKVSNAYAYGSRAPGSAHPDVDFKGVVRIEAPVAAPYPSAWFKPLNYVAPKDRPARDFIYGDVFIRKYLTATSANGGVGKSQILIAEALAVATGRPILGVTPQKRGRVWI